jgi:hypothetical protein
MNDKSRRSHPKVGEKDKSPLEAELSKNTLSFATELDNKR